MAWNVTQVTVDFDQNRAVVVFNQSGGIAAAYTSINVSFPLVDNNQPLPTTADKQALIKQAKQILSDAGS